MPIADLLLAGAELMVLGMGIVFAFLVILVFTLNGMSRLAAMVGAEEEGATPRPAVAPVNTSAESDAKLVAVISAAVARYRAAHNR